MTLSSISKALLASTVNQTSTEKKLVLTVFINVKDCGELFTNSPNSLFGQKEAKLLMGTDNHFWLSYNTLKHL